MKAAFSGLFLLLACFGAGSVCAQSTPGQQKTVTLPSPTLKRMELQLKQQRSEIADLKRQLDERDGELHSLLKLLSTQYASPKHPEKQEDPMRARMMTTMIRMVPAPLRNMLRSAGCGSQAGGADPIDPHRFESGNLTMKTGLVSP